VRLLLDGHEAAPEGGVSDRLASRPFVVVGITRGAVDPAWLALCDVVVAEDDPALEQIDENLAVRPIAATTLALLLRGAEQRSIAHGLVAESAAYSVLQAGPEFAAWREAHPARSDHDEGPRVRVERAGSTLNVTLTRPARLNALDAQMRDELVEAFALAAVGPELTDVAWRGEGRSFCAGGDLDEFGTRPDPASAHLVRLQRSIAGALAQVDKPIVTYLHGPCMGSGVELAAFTPTVVATADTSLGLPELGLGLIPGAGGTVSLTRRIGRLRTAWLAFSTRSIDVETAREWGLVDRIEG
jgi:hypothetical protein